ncbi:MAG: diguanylate cyclase, partial [Sulfuricellaceae bacterium]|nr:diguanylate cyclase [Sulfuricellaceae bacterium]
MLTQHRVTIGFGIVLLLMMAVGAIGLGRMAEINRQMERIVFIQGAQSELIVKMRDIVRERVAILQALLLSKDAFERDALLVSLDRTAGEFVQARDEYRKIVASPPDQALLREMLLRVSGYEKKVLVFSDEVREGRFGQAEVILSSQILPSLNGLLEKFRLMLDNRNSALQDAIQEAHQTYRMAVESMVLLGLLGVIFGGVTAVYVVRKTARAERDLFQQRDRAEVTLYSIADAVVTTDIHGRVEHMNPIAESLCGWTLAQARNHDLRSVFRVIDELTRQALNHPAYGMALDSHAVGISSHTLLLSRDGRELAIEDSVAPIHDGNGMAVGLVLVFRDVTESRSQARQLLWQASHDPLTGLTNRREFEVRLKHLLESARDGDAVHALLYMDLDQFKLVNDTCGHTAGDELLRELTVLLQVSLQATPATLARLGGDEFGILLECSPLDEAYSVAAGLLETVQGFRFVWDDKSFFIGASIGMVAVDKHSRDIG